MLKKILQIHFEFAYFSFFSYSFGIETLWYVLRPKWRKNLPDGAAHTYIIAYLRESPHPPGQYYTNLDGHVLNLVLP